MGRKRRGKAIHGWIIIDKPKGLSSSAVVGRVRRLTGAAKVGHAGTLDPLATGVLPMALGEATKTASYLMDGAKAYRFTVRWGEQRDTDDAEGTIVKTSDVRPTKEQILAVLGNFIGDIEQVPPVFSAIKIDGKRAYELARANRAPEMKPRTIHIEDLRLLGLPDGDHAEFEAVSGKGAYMRSLARDMAAALGTVGHIAQLRRTAVGPFDEKQAISLDKLETLRHSAPLSEHLLSVETALDDIPALALTETEARKLSRGQAIPVLPVASRSPLKNISQGDVVRAMAEGRLVALAKINGGEIRPFRVMNL
ncbi:MAG: tRNA pseudouridine(55) synthase TruB [Rhodospirillaceae bacterium]|jgi:tRNA pseudouridine55 synthase|nr:tRNA pseudouridine(55) synthase TruB [Rhodospirillaceae bacterium]|tara:strand:+ start:2371 stop:3297 length:927 start_codon:yes stop_codon:yes gene_type:complete